jgi:Domain of unknown function (DUF4159)/Prenyltransferase and squalene oxidase repeat
MTGKYIGSAIAAAGLLLAAQMTARCAEVTAEQVNTAIGSGVAFLEKQQRPDGRWNEDDSEPGGRTALCTLALLNCGRTAKDESVKRALAYLERQPDPSNTYNASLIVMAMAQADAKKYVLTIQRLALALASRQMRGDDKDKGGWSYKGMGGSSDNSNTQFAMLALHEAEKAGVKIPDQTWQLALNYWTQPRMQLPSGGFGYQPGHTHATGSMTCAAIASLIIVRDRLHPADARVVDGKIECCGAQPANDPIDSAMQWMGDHFSVSRNPNHQVGGWWLYYLYALERVGRMSGQRHFVTTRQAGRGAKLDAPQPHDWYREGCEVLLEYQDKFSHAWIGNGTAEGTPEIGTAFALLFLSKGRRPIVIGKLQHGSDDDRGTAEWDHHRRAVQNLTMRVEKQWRRDLSWQTIDFTRRGGAGREAVQVTVADLLEAPVLFLSGSQALDFSPQQRRLLKEYLENGGFLFAEACHGNGCDGTAFDRSFRALMQELFPDSELRRLPPDHAVWYAQEKVDPKNLPKDSEFWLWGLDACCRTSVVYCPRSLSCYWELAHPYRAGEYPPAVKAEIEQVARIGSNVLAYATSRELKEKLERPQIVVSNAGGRSPRGALVVPKLSHGGGADDAPAALNNLLTVMERQLQMKVDLEKRLIAPSDAKLLEYPIVFMHGRRAFRFSAAERKALKDWLAGGGFVFADAICANKEFAASLREELKAIYPDASFSRIPPTHPIFSEEFHGFNLASVELRDPQIRADNDPLTAKIVKTTPLLEGLEIDGRLAVILSPYDISCALERGASLDCKGYTPPDAARLGANVLLYALRQ